MTYCKCGQEYRDAVRKRKDELIALMKKEFFFMAHMGRGQELHCVGCDCKMPGPHGPGLLMDGDKEIPCPMGMLIKKAEEL